MPNDKYCSLLFRVEDYTDMETIYFQSLSEALDYVNTWNHNMTLQHAKIDGSWDDLKYYERIKK